jgi:hypothetical protein
MITLFTLPKPFLGHIGMIQRNAIQSWTRLHPDIDILIFGNEQGTAEVAAEFGIRHFPDVDVNEYGTPRMNGFFQQAEEAAPHSHMCYVNADIILFPDLLEAVAKVDLPKFVMGGLRTDYTSRSQSTSPVTIGLKPFVRTPRRMAHCTASAGSTTSSIPAACSAKSPVCLGSLVLGPMACVSRASSRWQASLPRRRGIPGRRPGAGHGGGRHASDWL